MEEIKIIEVIGTPEAITQSFGLLVFEKAKSFLISNQKIVISFKDILNVTSGFCNASIGKLYLEYPNKASELIEIKDISNEVWKEKIDESIMFALNPVKAEIRNASISQLFE